MKPKAAVIDSERPAPNFSKLRMPLARRKEILWKLMDICQSLHVGVEFAIEEFDSVSAYAQGEYDPIANHILVLRPLKSKDDVPLHMLWVFAHECRHAQQFNQRLKPDGWLFYCGGLVTEPTADLVWLENDADDWGTDFIKQHLTKKERDRVTFDE